MSRSDSDVLRIGISCYPTVGGSGIVATEIGLAMARRGHQVHVISTDVPRRLDRCADNVFFHQVRTRDYPVFPQAPYALALASTMASVATYEGLDVLHAHYAVPHATSAWMARQVLGNGSPKVVTTLHGTDATIGGEVTWNLPTPWTSALSTSVGGLPSAHEHDHEHAHGGDDPGFEAEGANFDSWLAGANYVAKYDYNDFHQFTGTLSGAWGDNAFGRNTSLYGVGLEYLWRENGYEPGGLSVRFRNEVMLRRIDALSGHLPGEEDPDHDEHGADQEEASHAATLDEMGASSLLVLGVNDRFETGVRGGWVSGIGEMSLDERWQVSPMLTYYLNSNRTLLTRVQYNWDHSDSFGDEHSIWFQIGFNWGGAEVR